ncbi:type I-C CRISPR-associated endonuclease Cas1c [Desulfomonile tiedjei]|uniref:CRISPR-associated endonuclease Cas1 n=1 Tax=Desulfomonile tiedjei (strain ATCC 49306 / DSM 6799 / DCB-1) TaxID=706587 RepID=I4C1T2_DESTA|nr:type I-C CRISPR-associated endonuclease Cas1c [Desulfomonile tiedjei]AFM23523.1 CRISPR-associated protein, Cas1 family [Desulfomonile tiedjei DSM 6799]
MKRVLNTLYVMTEGSYLSRDGDTVKVQVEEETRLRVPIHTLDGIVCFGRVTCSQPLMDLCCAHQVNISFMSMTGRFWARVQGPVHGNVLLRREHYRRADDQNTRQSVACPIVTAKVLNCRHVLLRAVRDHADKIDETRIRDAAAKLAEVAESLQHGPTLETVRALEGEAARHYFQVFDHLITVQKEDFFFRGRSRRPPLDSMNALLSFLYSVLTHDAVSSLEAVGLDPCVGFLHEDRPGRPSLALDLMEEFRPVLVDRLALSLVNRQQVRSKGFKQTESGAVLMDDETRKRVLTAYQDRKKEEITHPFLGEKMRTGLLVHSQALLFARYLRGDLDAYPPFFWR